MLLLAAVLASVTTAQPEGAVDQRKSSTQTEDVIHAVDEFMRSIKEQDPDLMASVTLTEGVVSGIIYKGDSARFRAWPFSEDRKRLAQGNESTWVESYWNPTVLIHKGIAVFWAPYSMNVDGRRLHCGIDVFNLARIEDEWKIVSIQFTAEPDGCPAGK